MVWRYKLYQHYGKPSGGPIVVNNAAYMAVAIILGLIMIVANILFAKFVIRPDVTKLKELRC